METDIDALRREQTDLRRRLDAIDGAIAEQQEPEVELGPTVTITIPSNGFEAPSDAELRTLQELVCSEYDSLTPCSDGAFERAFVAIGTMNRLSAPDRNISFHTHVDNVAEVAGQLGFIGAIPGNAVLLAVIAHGDVAWVTYDSSRGQMLEVALADRYRHGRPCSNAWRGLLAGQPFVPPLPPRQAPGLAPRGMPAFSVT